MRVKAGDKRKAMWNKAFFSGSLVASMSQGWMLGFYITGLQNKAVSLIFAALIAITLPALYVMLGAAWLMMKTETDLFNKAVKWARIALLPMGICLVLVSIATPLISNVIAERWFTLPAAIGLLPIPLSCALVYFGMSWLLTKPVLLKRGWGWLLFGGLVVICIMASLGLAYSIFPDIIIGRMDIWAAAAATDSLLFMLYGVVITLPAIIGYSIFCTGYFMARLRS